MCYHLIAQARGALKTWRNGHERRKNHQSFSKPSVSRAVGKLKSDGYILVDKSGFITLTESGRAIAERIYDRHNTLENIFMIIGVDQPTAEDDACKLEHYLSDTTYEALKKYFKI